MRNGSDLEPSHSLALHNQVDKLDMRVLLTVIFCSTLSLPCSAVELFGVPLAQANKGNLGMAARAAGAKLMDTGRPEIYEVFESTAVLSESERLYLGFDAQDNGFAFAEYHISLMSHRRMLAKLKRKYGEPSEKKGKFISDQLYRWDINGVSISYQRQFGCRCSALRYTLPAKLDIVKKQHLQVQKQRRDEDLGAQQGSY